MFPSVFSFGVYRETFSVNVFGHSNPEPELGQASYQMLDRGGFS